MTNRSQLDKSAEDRPQTTAGLPVAHHRMQRLARRTLTAPTFTSDFERRTFTQTRTPKLQTFDVFSNEQLIKPTWLKVSRTPYDEGHIGSGGYDMVVERTTVSHDSPDFFHIPEVYHAHPSRSHTTKARKAEQLAPQGRENSVNAPEWFNTTKELKPETLSHMNRGLTHHKLMIGHQVMCEPKKRHGGIFTVREALQFDR